MNPYRRSPNRFIQAAPAASVLGAFGLFASFASGGPLAPCCASADKAAENAKAGNDAFDLAAYQVAEDQANTFKSSLQVGGALDADSEGNLLVVWGSRRQENGSFGVFGQRYDALGRALGSELHINQRLRGAQQDPSITLDSNDVAWVVWQDSHQDGDRDGVFMRRFAERDGEFTAIGDEVQVNQTAIYSQVDPAIASNDNGATLITWTSMMENGELAVFGRVYDADGTPATDEFKVGADHSGTDRLSTIAPLNNGRFAIAWARTDSDRAPAGVFARIVNGEGVFEGEEFAVKANDGRDHIEPSMGSDDEGRFVIAWLQSREGEGYDIVARRFDADGAAMGEPFVVDDGGKLWKCGASVAVADDGRFIISWSAIGDKITTDASQRPTVAADVYARTYDAGANPVGAAWRVNQHTEGKHAHAIASNGTRSIWSDLDQLAFAWEGNAGHDRTGIGVTVMAPRTLEVEAPRAIARTPVVIGPVEYGEAPPEFNPDWKPEPPDVFIDEVGPDHGFQSFQTTPWQPPDPSIAAGPNHVVTVVNMEIKVHTKDGVETYHDLFENIFRPLGGGTFIFDPVAYYDQFADRFVVCIAEHNGSLDRLNMMISKTTDPNDGWHLYHFDVDRVGDFIDFQNLGISDDAYFVTADYFGSPGGNFVHIMEKAPMLNGDPVDLVPVRTRDYLISLGAVKSYDADAPAQYFATSWDGNQNQIRIFGVTDPLGSPQVHNTTVGVSFYDQPPSATQRGSGNRVATIDFRIKHGVYRNGSLWLTHSIGQNSTARVRWYEIDMNGWPTSGQQPALIQEGTFNYGSGQHSWFPDVGVSEDGDVVITCSRSSSSDYPYIARAVRKAGDPLGTFRESIRLQESTGPHEGGRWGDYSGVDEDPANPGAFWSHNEYTIGGLNWRTWVAEVDTDRSMVLTSAPIVRGQESTLTATGAGANSSVYFAYSFTGENELFIPALNVTVGIDRPQLLSIVTADANGVASLTRRVPANAPIGPIWLQAAENNNSSNVVRESVN